jgi:hypothetical protein
MADINWPLPSGVFIDLINQNTNIVVITAKVSLLVKALFGKYGVTREFNINNLKRGSCAFAIFKK